MPDPLLTLLLDFDDQVRRDQEQSPVFLHRRDRRFALDCAQQGLAPDPQHWLAHLHRLNPRPAVTGTDPRLLRWQLLGRGFALAGAVFGVLTMLGLLFYDGSQRINLTVILGFVALQLLFALATTVQAVAGWQPWGWLMAQLGRHDAPSSPALARLRPQLMARIAHTGGLLFGIAGLLTLLVLVVVQDLAFGWSTTLDTGAAGYHRLLGTIATPWQWLWPAAVPDLALVEATRFFRLQADSGTIGVSRWGDWWPFVTMTWLVYVIAPRLLLLLLARAHLQRQIRRTLAHHPGLTALQYRMETPALDTGNQRDDSHHQPDLTTASRATAVPAASVIIRWAGAEPPPQLASAPSLAAGGSATLAQDRQTQLDAAAELAAAGSPAVILVTRGWEPPTGELADFLETARELWPGATRIALLPLAVESGAALPDHQLSQWLRFSERRQDPLLQVATATGLTGSGSKTRGAAS